MISDAALLLLIADDRRALGVLAAWGALAPALDKISDEQVVQEIAEISSVHFDQVSIILQRLLRCRVIVDGGISELADKMLQSCVQAQLSGAGKKR